MLTIYTRLVYWHPFVTERAVMFSTGERYFGTKRYPCEKFKSKQSIVYQSSDEHRKPQVDAAAR